MTLSLLELDSLISFSPASGGVGLCLGDRDEDDLAQHGAITSQRIASIMIEH